MTGFSECTDSRVTWRYMILKEHWEISKFRDIIYWTRFKAFGGIGTDTGVMDAIINNDFQLTIWKGS